MSAVRAGIVGEVHGISVQAAGGLIPHAVLPLVELADAEGIRNVGTLVDRWVNGQETYNQPGEAILAAVSNTGEVLGIGGIARCPTVPGALRVRRFYVHPNWRRRGIAKMLATALVTDGALSVSTITCNAAASDASGPFWEAMGFKPVDIWGITHFLRSSDTATGPDVDERQDHH
jgi:GNAT superfamily N-acetyltransferase